MILKKKYYKTSISIGVNLVVMFDFIFLRDIFHSLFEGKYFVYKMFILLSFLVIFIKN